jgi:antitoxin component YwqK of YwqJK toxin-antitoxin module
LKQTDFDGAFEYSDIRVVSNAENEQLLIYPNPSNSGKINFSKSTDIGEVSIFTAEGKLIYSGLILNSLELELKPGVYVVQFNNGKELESRKIIITR